MRIGHIDDCDMVNGGRGNVAHTIFFAGCSRGCIGCQNPTLQPKNSGQKMILNEVAQGIRDNTLATCVVLTGGEPLEQADAATAIAAISKQEGKSVWLYTSYELSEIPDLLLEYCDVVKTGRYIESLRTTDGPLATSNQRYYIKGDDGAWISS